MPINQPSTAKAAPVPQIAPPAQTASNQRSAAYTFIQGVKVRLAKIESAIGLSGLACMSSGAVLAVFCTAWAIHEGALPPLAIMIGYCTAVGSACLCAALLVIQRAAPKAKSIGTRPEPNLAAWKLVSRLSVSDASRLWCDIEPGCPASQESIAWGIAMLDAIKRGELPATSKANGGQTANIHGQRNPGWTTLIGREALISWAQAHGHSPRFLQK